MATNKEQFNNDMNALSNAINEKTGGTEPMTISEMLNAVKSISSGGVDEDTLYTELLNGSYGSEQTVNITLHTEGGPYSEQTAVAVKFGSQPSDDSDVDYYAFDAYFLVDSKNNIYYTTADNLKIDVPPVVYIWQRKVDSLAGYRLNNLFYNAGVGYSNATKVDLKDGDVLSLVSTLLD